MLDYLFIDANLPFSVALAVMAGIGLLEGVATIMGAGLSQLLDAALPDLDANADLGVDLDADADVGVGGGLNAHSAVLSFLGWLYVGKVPVLVLLVIFLTGFGLCGLGVQGVAIWLFESPLPPWLASLPAVVGALPFVRALGGGFLRWFPSDHTEAVSRSSFVGQIAEICGGRAKAGSPAQAKLKDGHGQTHYVLVEPDSEHEVFSNGTQVLLISQHGVLFKALRGAPPELEE